MPAEATSSPTGPGEHGRHDGHGGHGAVPARGEAPLAMVIPLTVTAAISVVIGVAPGFFLQLARAVFP